MTTTRRPRKTIITSLRQLSATEPTAINPMTSVEIPGLYLDFDGNTDDALAKGARWTLRHLETNARLRDLVIA